MYDLNINLLVGKTLTSVEKNKDNDEIVFCADDGDVYKLYHLQGCCESVTIESVVGDLADLVGSPILQAEAVSSADEPAPKREYEPESFTWTFYKLGTTKGHVTLRWLGESNGYYSESVDFTKVK